MTGHDRLSVAVRAATDRLALYLIAYLNPLRPSEAARVARLVALLAGGKLHPDVAQLRGQELVRLLVAVSTRIDGRKPGDATVFAASELMSRLLTLPRHPLTVPEPGAVGPPSGSAGLARDADHPGGSHVGRARTAGIKASINHTLASMDARPAQRVPRRRRPKRKGTRSLVAAGPPRASPLTRRRRLET